MDKMKKYIIAIITITLFGEAYFYIFEGIFRFSISVVAMSLALLLYPELREIYLGIFTGISILILRVFIQSMGNPSPLIELVKINIPGSLYYVLFGILFYLTSIKRHKDDPIRTILTLSFLDIACNIFELILRKSFNNILFHYILIIGLVRSIASYVIFIIFKNQELLIKKKEHQKRYVQLNTIISNIQAEMFYLTKSMQDIENVMSKSHSLYGQYRNDPEIGKSALDIALEVHEIKKDYHRVINGLRGFLEDFEDNDAMSFKDIITIIEDNINRYIKQNKKDVNISFETSGNVYVQKYYPIFTILNNLIINAIDASRENGTIKVCQNIYANEIILQVSDDGEGIDHSILPYIFNPGFTTKFDNNTGEPSTGIGLSHIKNIVEEMQGSLELDSKKDIGTKFTIHLPLNSLKRR